jgi:hypothetical protein
MADRDTNGIRAYSWEEVEAILAQNADKISNAAVKMIQASSPGAIVSPGGDAVNTALLQRIDRSLGVPRRKDMNVESFGGDNEEDWLDYLTKFTAAANWNSWNEVDRLHQMIGHLKGNALALYADHRPEKYSQLVKVITNRYAPEGSEESFKMKFRSQTMGLDGNASIFAQTLARLARRAFPNWGNDVVSEYVLDQFKQGLTDEGLRKHVMLGKYQSLNEAVVAVGAYQRFEESSRPSRAAKPRATAKCAAASTETNESPEEDTVQQSIGKLCAVMRDTRKDTQDAVKAGVEAAMQGQGRTPNTRRRREIDCFCCKELGHTQYNCPKNRKRDYKMTQEEQRRCEAHGVFLERRKQRKGGKGESTPPPTTAEQEAAECPEN